MFYVLYYEHVMVLLKPRKELMTDEASFRTITAAVKCRSKRFFPFPQSMSFYHTSQHNGR